jgi:pimeloyl-ACP methyl ester carboxylesterase
MLSAILLPGLDGTGDLFAPFVAAAPTAVHAVVVRYPANEASLEALERHARDQLTDPCIVIAESFSGLIGARLASDPKVRALVLCNSFVSSPVPTAIRHLPLGPLFEIPAPASVLRFVLLGKTAEPELVARTQSAIRRVPGRVFAERITEICRTDAREALRSLSKPILYLRGADDRTLSERCWNEIHEVRPDAEIVTIDGPHLLLQTAPRECWRAIQRFIGL